MLILFGASLSEPHTSEKMVWLTSLWTIIIIIDNLGDLVIFYLNYLPALVQIPYNLADMAQSKIFLCKLSLAVFLEFNITGRTRAIKA